MSREEEGEGEGFALYEGRGVRGYEGAMMRHIT